MKGRPAGKISKGLCKQHVTTKSDIDKLILADIFCDKQHIPHLILVMNWVGYHSHPVRGLRQTATKIAKFVFWKCVQLAPLPSPDTKFYGHQGEGICYAIIEICVKLQRQLLRRSREKLQQGKCSFGFATIHLVARHVQNT